MGFPDGPVNLATIFGLASPDVLLLATEHWHHDALRRAGKRVVWRAIPRLGRRPAELKWNADNFANEAMNLTETVSQYITDFIPWNELDLRTERGDQEDDFADLDQRYARIGMWGAGVISWLKQHKTVAPFHPDTKIHWPAFTPNADHAALDNVWRWRGAAESCDIIDFHAYDTLDKIQREYGLYRAAFPTYPLALTEWHCRGDVEEERRVLQWLADTMDADPLFDSGYRFIWRWHHPSSDWSPSFDVEGNPEMVALFMNPPVAAEVAAPPVGEPEHTNPMTEYEIFCRAEAARRGIDPDIAVRAANSEGSLTEPARRGTFDTGSSWWAFQLHYGGPGYEYLGTVAGMGNDFSAFTKWAPGDPRAWRDAMRYALDAAHRGGWGPWYGARAQGITGFMGINREGGRTTEPTEWDFLANQPTGLSYNPDARVDVQPDDWSCSVEATAWLLRSLGRNPSRGWLESQLVPFIVTPQTGLLLATGVDLSAWITREYGSEMGFAAEFNGDCTFEQVEAMAGEQPVIIGGRHYGPGGHWTGVRRADENGWLELANPAPNYTNTGTHLDRDEWDARGPWSMIWVPIGEQVAVPAPPPAPVDETAVLREEVARLKTVIGYITVDIASAIEKEVDSIEFKVAVLGKMLVDLNGNIGAARAALDTLKTQKP